MEFFPVSPADYQDASCTSSKSQLNELESHQVSMYPYDISPAALHQSEPFQSLSSQPHCNLSVSLAKSEGYPIQTTTAIPELVFLGDDSFNTDILNGEIIDGIQEDQDFPKTPIFLEQLRTPSPCKNHGATTGTDLSISLSPSSRKALNYDDLFFSYTQPIQSMGNFEAGCSLDYGYPFLIAERFPKSDLYDYDYNNQNNLNELFSPHISQAVMSPKNVDWCQEVLLGSKSEPLTVTAEARKDSDSKPENHDHNGSLRGFGMLHHDFHNSRPPTAFLLSEGLVDRELGGYIEGEATDPQRFAEQETLKSNKSCFFMCKDPSKRESSSCFSTPSQPCMALSNVNTCISSASETPSVNISQSWNLIMSKDMAPPKILNLKKDKPQSSAPHSPNSPEQILPSPTFSHTLNSPISFTAIETGSSQAGGHMKDLSLKDIHYPICNSRSLESRIDYDQREGNVKRSRGRRPPISFEFEVLAPEEALSFGFQPIPGGQAFDPASNPTANIVKYCQLTKTGKCKKIFICQAKGCGKCFKRREHLKRHVLSIHTNDKPFKCHWPECNKTFSRHDNLNQHLKVHRSELGGQQNFPPEAV